MKAGHPASRLGLRGIPSGHHDGSVHRAGELSQLERLIIGLLQDDGRMPSSEIARNLSVSEPTVRRQIQRLVNDGDIAITAVADPRLLGLHAMAWVGIAVSWPLTDDIQGSLLKIPGVDYIATTSGRFQVFAEIAARDTAELSSRLDLVRALPGVVLTETFPYLDLYYMEYRWLGSGSGADRTRRSGPDVQEVTELDREVILELSSDGRQSFRQIGRAIRVPEHQVRGAYSKLIGTGALRVMAVLNPARLGFDTMALVGIRVNPNEGVWNVADALARARSVDHVVICTGRFDIIAEIWARSREEMATIVERELGAIQDIAYTELFQYLRLQYSNENVWGVNRTPASEVQT